ncbi:hypothetical protein C0W35_21005 [Photobacterium kishitanii]|uniref:hypothetical protein n=1 Tax=Photobacterium kishitanii TaxID=318456 RepID=UPI000D1712F2|nr:hypothetical protein [Photobacterium kishitanii]PSU87906.1 hypothetical protein C0W35_21005 [Photobacterium kishitanii]
MTFFKKIKPIILTIVIYYIIRIIFSNWDYFISDTKPIPPKKYVLIQGEKPQDAIISGSYTFSDTNKACIHENWLSGTNYMSSGYDKLEFITYSSNGKKYEIKVLLTPKYYDNKCESKVNSIKLGADSPGGTGFASLRIYIRNSNKYEILKDISKSKKVTAVCQSYINSYDKKWTDFFECVYDANGSDFTKHGINRNPDVFISKNNFKDKTIITYNIIAGKNYFLSQERPEINKK